MNQINFIALIDKFTKFYKIITKASYSETIFRHSIRAFAIDKRINDSSWRFVI